MWKFVANRNFEQRNRINDAPDLSFGLANPFLSQSGTVTGNAGTAQGAGVYESFSGMSGQWATR